MNYMHHIFEKENKNNRSLFSNYFFYMSEMKKWNTILFWIQFIIPIPLIAYGYLISWIPAEIIYSIEHGSWKDDFLLILAGGVACYICGLIKNVSAQYNYEQYDFLPLHYMKIFEKKMMHIRYEEIKKEKNKKDIDNSWSSAMYGRGVSDAINQFSDFFSYGLASIVYGIIICKLSFFILIVCIISMICSLKLLKIAREKHGIQFKNIGVYAKEADYLTHSSTDPIKGKDIRFFKYRTLFMKYYKNDLKNIHKIYATIHNWYTVRNVVDGFLSFVRNLLVYSILILEFYQGGLSLSQFVFYFGIVTSFTEGFETLCRAVMKFNSINSSISSIRDFLEIDDVRNDEQKISDEEFNKMKKKSISIKWDHVSFRYSEEADYIYKDLSFEIHEGEKIAIIGMNGVGKSTLAKLICGLYKPESGTISFQGIPMERFTQRQIFELVSALFQSSTFLPVTIDENIACNTIDQIDVSLLNEVLENAGIESKYNRLKDKGKTLLDSSYHENATDFSGGEKQKFLFSRLLYKDSPVVILDEPTAALDAISEYEFYKAFARNLKSKTAIFISHRLSSTRFCDRIFLIENGKIIEEGTHEQLLSARNRYYDIFCLQGKYYKDTDNSAEV